MGLSCGLQGLTSRTQRMHEGFLHVSRVERCLCVFILIGPEISLLTEIFDQCCLEYSRLMFVNPA